MDNFSSLLDNKSLLRESFQANEVRKMAYERREALDSATEHIAKLLHVIIFHVRLSQLFHRLRVGVRDVGAFSEAIALALKDFQRELPKLESDVRRDLGDEALSKFKAWFYGPNGDDVKLAQLAFSEDRDYLKVLLARASGFCPLCIEALRR